MTTPSTAARPSRWWQWVGPWPLRPLAVGLLTGIFALATTSYSLTQETAVQTIGSAALAGASVGLTMWLARRLAPQATQQMLGYLVAVALVALVGNAVRVVTGTILPFPEMDAVSNFVFTWIRSIAFALVILALLGASQRRLQRQAEALLNADEEVRRQVALLLHDRVQAGLISACLRLRRTMGGDAQRDEQVQAVTDELERLRALDVRRAVHALSPNLSDVDLVTALDELADTYRPSIDITVILATGVQVPSALHLGIYRIVEQGLLNAAIHGRADHCTIVIEVRRHSLLLRVIDDGAGMPPRARSGFGTTLIDTWCRILGGSWSRGPAGGGGTELRVSLPAP